MRVRAYDPTLGRFIARDPLGRTPLMGWTGQPYAYAGNNPLRNVDPSGQRFLAGEGGALKRVPTPTVDTPPSGVQTSPPCLSSCQHNLALSGFRSNTLPLILNVGTLVVAGIRLVGDWFALQKVWGGWNLDSLTQAVPETVQLGIGLLTVIAQAVSLGAKVFGWAVSGVMQFVDGAIAG
jgi:hypothetical protein